VGWISGGALDYVCRRLTVPPAEAYGVASFYGLLSLERRPAAVVHVCDDIVCRARGAEALCRSLETTLGAPGRGRGRTWFRSPCLGLCESAPGALLTRAGESPAEAAIPRATPAAVLAALEGAPPSPEEPTVPQKGEAGLTLLARIGRGRPGSLDDYRAHGGYEALRRALLLGPDGVIREVQDAKLVGRGGAAFPTGRKWEAVAKSPIHPHYLVCNADESEPGTFKDRVLMEGDPFALVEAMTIAAYAAGVSTGYLYVRGEYPLAFERLSGAVETARRRGFLGGGIMGHPFTFDIVIRRGAGAYICGEETALFNSIEGFRGEPRNKPPFPTTSGLFGKPTLVNNVETLVNVLPILKDGGPAYARIGTGSSTGTKLFCVSGCVARPGVYEVPFGETLSALVARAGGVPAGRTLRTVLLGGAAGTFVTPGELDCPLTFEGVRGIGASLGSGVVLVLDDTVDLWGTVLRIASFFRDESCGQCVPCRVGTVRQEEALVRLSKGKRPGDLVALAEVGQVMRDASICGLGQTASAAVQSALAKLDLGGAR
jgi:NADH-quinone oxidoreductase subunit F